jgi:hypothetical protein
MRITAAVIWGRALVRRGGCCAIVYSDVGSTVYEDVSGNRGWQRWGWLQGLWRQKRFVSSFTRVWGSREALASDRTTGEAAGEMAGRTHRCDGRRG